LLHQEQVQWLQAGAVVLATGGGGQVFAQTTNPTVSTGDGVALAWRAGAIIQDPEFVQFHPTALMKEGAPHFLISEAVRGEGAHLVDATGDRFAFTYHPDGELAPRDVVSRAIYSHLQKTAPQDPHACVYLDLRPIERDHLLYRFPNILKRCQQWGINPLLEPIPVAPAAHYWMGGIYADLHAQTSIPGLYAIGETASTGVHGANRLASNSLLECIVFAAQLTKLSPIKTDFALPIAKSTLWQGTSESTHDLTTVQSLRQALPILVWQNAGICRTQLRLETAIAQINQFQTDLSSINPIVALDRLEPDMTYALEPDGERLWKLAAEIRNLLDIAHLILRGAMFRQESRGGHFRADYPQTNPQWQGHTQIQDDRLWFNSLRAD
jgi:L-aspartate oxidase